MCENQAAKHASKKTFKPRLPKSQTAARTWQPGTNELSTSAIGAKLQLAESAEGGEACKPQHVQRHLSKPTMLHCLQTEFSQLQTSSLRDPALKHTPCPYLSIYLSIYIYIYKYIYISVYIYIYINK